MPRKPKPKNREKGLGTIEYRKDRPNPYRAKICDGTKIDSKGRQQTKYRTLGSFKTKAEAEKALLDFDANPFNLAESVNTFEELYEKWFAYYTAGLKSESSKRTITSAYEYCSQIYRMPIREIGPGHIKDVMQQGFIIVSSGKDKGKKRYASTGTKERIKSMCNLMFDYAVEHRILLYNPARAFTVGKLIKEIEENRKIKQIYTNEQVDTLWRYLNEIPNTDIILIGLYTGFRPQELFLLETKNISLKENKIVGGMKTENGRNRTVPIHPRIKPLIEARMKTEKKVYKTGLLFNDTKRMDQPRFTYDRFRDRFEDVMRFYHFEGFTPHCMRHTFATAGKNCGMDNGILKRILGHSLARDITESVYIHPTFDNLMTEMKKLDYSMK